MRRASIGTTPAVLLEQTIKRGNDGLLPRARSKRERDIIEGTIEIEGRCQFLIRHPENPIGAVVGQCRARTRLEDILRRKDDAGNLKLRTSAVQ